MSFASKRAGRIVARLNLKRTSPNPQQIEEIHNAIKIPESTYKMSPSVKASIAGYSGEKEERAYEDGSRYFGDLLGGQRHGHGIYTFPDGAKYLGEFQYDRCHGHGAFSFATGDKYFGEFVSGLRHGQGTYTFADGSNFVGDFKDDQYHGNGVLSFATGRKYMGEFLNGQRHGFGTLVFADGEKYVWARGRGKWDIGPRMGW